MHASDAYVTCVDLSLAKLGGNTSNFDNLCDLCIYTYAQRVESGLVSAFQVVQILEASDSSAQQSIQGPWPPVPL